MHNLALALHQKGDEVTGSDDAIFDPSLTRLKNAGLLPSEMGWFPEKITSDIEAVILGMHAKEDNPELKKAQKLGLKIYSYPEFLYLAGRDKTRVVIGGSHGKTTITAMILHVLHYHGLKADYMVGAQLKGFDTMVHITEENRYMVLEGDEYLTSPIDLRPKFHLYKPQIALLSGIAWDHINVFPTFENYVEQFRIFADTMPEDGVLIYNEEDSVLKEVVANARVPKNKIAYRTPEYRVENGITFLETDRGDLPLEIFGKHNLSNLVGAREICKQMGVDYDDFHKAIISFEGAAKRLEKVAESADSIIFKDYAHSPSKVQATTKAVKQQYPDRKLLACFELHTYSSLDAGFLDEYKNALDSADEAVVFYSPAAVKIKRLENIDSDQIRNAFQYPNLKVFTTAEEFKAFLEKQNLKNTVLLLMSSGNYGGLDFDAVSKWI